jgi:nitroimidazol reductase NimA-like FMN-containing flavoprotein (pyridoxamine 5'-phosphate oxidase superfamily)
MPSTVEPKVRVLTRNEAEALLSRNQVGRIAFAQHDRVDIEPISYVYDAPWIFGRTAVGAKLVTLAHNRWCAFETDEVRGLLDWQSVVVKGPFEAFNSSIDTSDRYERAVAAIRTMTPDAFGAGDPTPQRTVVFGIHASEIEGRASSTKGSGG